MRTVLVALVAIGLAFGVVLLWPDGDGGDPPTTEAILTTATTGETSTTESQPTTITTTEPGSHVVETVEEAEEILRQLWFGWFEGIYNQDEDRIREVVATEHQMALASDQFGVMELQQAPKPTDITYEGTEILRADDDCVVVWTQATFTGFTSGATSDLHVLRWNDGWKFFSLWSNREDLWESDCNAQLG